MVLKVLEMSLWPIGYMPCMQGEEQSARIFVPTGKVQYDAIELPVIQHYHWGSHWDEIYASTYGSGVVVEWSRWDT